MTRWRWASARRGGAGLAVPDELVTGWDDIMAARHAELTTVRQPLRDLGAPPHARSTT